MYKSLINLKYLSKITVKLGVNAIVVKSLTTVFGLKVIGIKEESILVNILRKFGNLAHMKNVH